MKKKLFLVAFVAFGMLFTSCKADDGDDNFTPPKPTADFKFWHSDFGAAAGKTNRVPIWITEDGQSLIKNITDYKLTIKDPSIATIDKKGIITGVKMGVTDLVVSYNNQSIETTITVFSLTPPLWKRDATIDEVKAYEEGVPREFVENPDTDITTVLFFLGENEGVVDIVYNTIENEPITNKATMLNHGSGNGLTFGNMFPIGVNPDDEYEFLFSNTEVIEDATYTVGLRTGYLDSEDGSIPMSELVYRDMAKAPLGKTARMSFINKSTKGMSNLTSYEKASAYPINL